MPDILDALRTMASSLQNRIEHPLDSMVQGLQTTIEASPEELLNTFAGAGVIKNITSKAAGEMFAKVPKTLLGYPASGPAKGFDEVAYKTKIPVKVEFLDKEGKVTDSIIDGMNGLNVPHAMARANINWAGDVRGANDVRITQLTKEQVLKEDKNLHDLLFKEKQ